MKGLNIILKHTGRLLFSAFLVSIFTAGYCQETIRVVKIDGGITFDGIPDEEVWKGLRSYPFTMHNPYNGKIPEQLTDARICYDDNYLYVGASLHYNSSRMISRIGKKRDYFDSAWSSDWLFISVDTYNDKQNMIVFGVNPNGIRYDFAVKNDYLNPATDSNASFNTFWEARSRVIDSIWYTEVRIPLSSLRFQGNSEKVVMGITLMRNIANTDNPDCGRSTFPQIPRTRGSGLFFRPSMAAEFEFQGLKSAKPVYFAPYLTGGFNRYYSGETSSSETEKKLDAGADIKLGLTNNLTLDITANTDFAEVEADKEQFNLSRFSLFFPEKRLFFMEKADVFDFSFNGSDNLFYSRNIGLYNGEPVRIYGGVRLTGRIRKWELGMLDMQTAKIDDHTAENFAVFRTKRGLGKNNSFIGGMVTSRIGADGTKNLAYGADAKILLFGDDYFTLKWAQTFEDGVKLDALSLKPSQLYLNWEKVRLEGLSYKFLMDWSGENYNPGTGIETRNNFFLKSGTLSYGWLPGDRSYISKNQISTVNSVYSNSVNNSFESFQSITGWAFESKKSFTGSAFFNYYLEDLKNTFYIVNPDISVPAGRYSFFSISGKVVLSTPDRIAGLTSTTEIGSFYDGSRISGTISPNWNPCASVIIEPTYSVDRVEFGKRNQKYTNNIVGLRGTFMFTTKLALTTYIQYNTFSNKIITNARLRYNPREGNDLYLVYNEGIDSRYRTNLIIDRLNENRTILLKYTYTFTL
jgi:hypothetical protein